MKTGKQRESTNITWADVAAGDAPDIPVTWDEQVHAVVDCYNAGATAMPMPEPED